MDRWFFNPLGFRNTRDEYEARVADQSARLTLGRQIALYVTLLMGNIASSFMTAFQGRQAWRPDIMTLVFAVVSGFVLLPGAVDASKLNGQKEELVQFATVFTYGMGSQTLVSAAIRAVTGG
jgi:hypothetical protein